MNLFYFRRTDGISDHDIVINDLNLIKYYEKCVYQMYKRSIFLRTPKRALQNGSQVLM
jgi:hypothetical protein